MLTICLSLLDHFVRLAFKGLKYNFSTCPIHTENINTWNRRFKHLLKDLKGSSAIIPIFFILLQWKLHLPQLWPWYWLLCLLSPDWEKLSILYNCIITEAATRGVLYKKGVLRNFTKFTGKHLCQSLFFNKVAGPRPDVTDLVYYQKDQRSSMSQFT